MELEAPTRQSRGEDEPADARLAPFLDAAQPEVQIVAPQRLPYARLAPKCGDVWYSMRRYYVDEFYTRHVESLAHRSSVIDIGGMKARKRGQFDLGRFVESRGLRVTYLNCDARTGPDIHGDACAIPAPDGTFDCAILSEVLEHLADPRTALQEASRVLRPGGTLLACAPFMYQVHPDPTDVGRYAPDWWRAALATAAFAEAQIEIQGMYWSVLADLLRAWACHLEDRKAWFPGVREPALGFLRWFRETAYSIESGRPQPGSFYAAFTTGFGVRAVKR